MRVANLFSLIIIFSIISLLNTYAQDNSSAMPQFALRTDVIPASPNAASLAKYGLIPISLQTGLPNISIPITELKGKQLSLPITLNYHNSGLKPGEEASWVGLGWSLNAGGVITRTVRDKVDEFMTVAGQYSNIAWRYKNTDSLTQHFIDSAMYQLRDDVEPDYYTFNFAGKSGKFIIYKGAVFQFPYQQFVISGDPSNGFTITTPDGVQYNFTVPEIAIAHINQSADPSVYQLPTRYVSSWYLQTIVSADSKDKISLTYAKPDTLTQSAPGTQTMTIASTDGGTGQEQFSPISFPFPNQLATLRIASITTSKETINFNGLITRSDMPGKELDNIEVRDYQGKLITRFKFQYGYFAAGNTAIGKPYSNVRLKLSSLQEGVDTTHSLKHFFYYNNLNDGFGPSKKYASTDDWGYWNSYNDIASDGTGCLIPRRYYSKGMIKDPNSQYSQQGVLNRIVYPTGGSTFFQYEPNIYNNGLNYVMNNISDDDQIIRPDSNSTNAITHNTTININTAQMIHVTSYRVPKRPVDGTTGNTSSDPTKDNNAKITITGPSGSNSKSYSFFIRTNSDNSGRLDSLYLQPGSYTIQLQCDKLENVAGLHITYLQQTNQVIEGKVGPGIRIKKIIDYPDSLGNSVSNSTREYVYKDETGLSTGVLLHHTSYEGKPYTVVHYEEASGIHPITTNYTAYTSYNTSYEPTSQEMYYQTVYEKQSNGIDYLLSKSEYLLPDPAIEYGTDIVLTRKTDFKKIGSNYSPVFKEEYNYTQLLQDSIFTAIKPYISIRRIPGGSITEGFPYDKLREWGYDLYVIDPSWMRLNSKRQVNYSLEGDSTVITSSYVYTPKLHNVFLTTISDSKGNTKVQKKKYSEHYAISVFTPGTNQVVENQLWQKHSSTDSVMLSGTLIQYDQSLRKPKTLYQLASQVALSKPDQESVNSAGMYTSLISDSRYQSRLTNNYNTTSGNLIAQDMTNSNTSLRQVNYLWGYSNNYPIAEVKNADPSAIAYSSFEDDNSSWVYSSSGVISTDSHTGAKCYTGTISKSSLPQGNYVVGFWAKGGGAITVGSTTKSIAANWTYYQVLINNINSISINTSDNFIDELRLYPQGAQVTTYTYSPLVGMTSQTDAGGHTTYYEYDGFQRLVNIKDQNGKILKHYDYHYQGQ